jgi:hypothetical protein
LKRNKTSWINGSGAKVRVAVACRDGAGKPISQTPRD